MELRVQITTKGRLFDGRASELISSELTVAMYEATQLIERNVKRFTPAGVYGAQGGLLSTIHGEVVGKGTPLVKGIIAHSSQYGDVIEKGRRPGQSWPPEGALLRWMEVKLGLDDEQAKRLEFVIRRKIGKKGFPGAQMFEKGLNASMNGLDAIFDKRGFSIARKLSE